MIVKTLFLLYQVLCKKFIIEIYKNQEEFQMSRFFADEYENFVDSFEINDFEGYIMDYDSFPVHLFEYSFIKSVEEDLEVSIDYNSMLSKKKFFDLVDEEPYLYASSFFLQDNPVWGLDRSDQRNNVLNKKYYYPVSSGKDVDVYVVDTGIDTSHYEFEGRAVWGINTVDSVDTDCNSHGTHVAGTIGSKTFGLAKKTTLYAVKVLDCRGSGSFSGILKGLEYVNNNHKKSSGRPSVINMSLGGPKSSSINLAVSEIIKSGIHVVAAAGNENSDACNTSPASQDSVMTVGATSINNEMAQFSNWGKCVDILAPGVDIKSTIPGRKIADMSGTSMASPHVAGAYAVYLSSKDNASKLTPLEVKNSLVSGCSKNSISKMKKDTVNCLMFSLL